MFAEEEKQPKTQKPAVKTRDLCATHLAGDYPPRLPQEESTMEFIAISCDSAEAQPLIDPAACIRSQIRNLKRRRLWQQAVLSPQERMGDRLSCMIRPLRGSMWTCTTGEPLFLRISLLLAVDGQGFSRSIAKDIRYYQDQNTVWSGSRIRSRSGNAPSLSHVFTDGPRPRRSSLLYQFDAAALFQEMGKKVMDIC